MPLKNTGQPGRAPDGRLTRNCSHRDQPLEKVEKFGELLNRGGIELQNFGKPRKRSALRSVTSRLNLTQVPPAYSAPDCKFLLSEAKVVSLEADMKTKPLLSIGHVRGLVKIDASLAFADPRARIAMGVIDPTESNAV